ncbi:plastocyanin/azurin family copper-binding protein [Haloplanus litoreus]|uniref:plastocyanin/azurin family copper-binding protein n=1 Tax=Haloplanus litoreus TaxID=767515 RepID=UPI00361AE8EA
MQTEVRADGLKAAEGVPVAAKIRSHVQQCRPRRAAGCSGGNSGDGGDGGDGGGEATATATSTPEPTATATATATSTPAGEADATIAVGPGGSLQFEPDNTAVSQGDTVEFVFESGGHNVSGHPDAHSAVSLPEGRSRSRVTTSPATTSTTSRSTRPVPPIGTPSKRRVSTRVCVPHAASGMIGTIVVR